MSDFHPVTHDLKIWPEYFEPVADGRKRFELRTNDRGFKVFDTLILREWSPETKQYSGRVLRFTVGYVLPVDGTDKVVLSLMDYIGELED